MINKLFMGFFLITATILVAQSDGDVIINEIGNHGTKKAMYTGGDYIELIVLKNEGIKLAGWYLTDLSSTTGKAKETEGSIKLSDKEGSLFNQILPRGTYILICFGNSAEKYGGSNFEEITELKDGGNLIVVFTESSDKHIEKNSGTMDLTGKDNVALLSDWNKHSAVDLVSWEGTSSWDGAAVTELTLVMVENGKIIYFNNDGENLKDNTANASWISISDVEDATPGKTNKGVDDSTIRTK